MDMQDSGLAIRLTGSFRKGLGGGHCEHVEADMGP